MLLQFIGDHPVFSFLTILILSATTIRIVDAITCVIRERNE